MKIHFVVVALLVACKGGDGGDAAKPTTQATGSAAPAKTEPVDPWADKPAVVRPPADQKLVDLVQKGPTTIEYPQADAYVAEDRDDIVLGADGTVVESHHSIVKILDAQRGKEKFADVHVTFDKTRQTLEIVTARTATADGEIHVASKDEITDIVPAYLADATNYSDVRERVISFPAVDTGSVVELVWTRTTKGTPDSAQGGEQILAHWDPVKSRIVTITTPTSITPKIALTNTDVKPVESASGGTHTYTITVADLPDIHPEGGQPDDAAILPRVVFGFKPDWAAVLAPLADRFLKAAIPEPLPAVVVAKAHELVANAKTDDEKARALYQFVSREIRTIELPLGAAGYEPHAPDVVLANRYGDERDKTALMLALCSAEKLRGGPVLVRTGAVPVLAQVPTLAQFDRMVAKLAIDGKDVWVAPSDDHGQYGIVYSGQGNLVLPVAHEGTELGKRELLDPSTSTSKITAQYTLAENGDLDAKFHYDLSGWFANTGSRWLQPLVGENLEKEFQSQAANVAAGAVDAGHTVPDAKSGGPLALDHHVTAQGYSQTQGGFRVLEIPRPSLDVARDMPPAGTSDRKYTLYMGTPRTQVADVSVKIPAGWKVAFVPPALSGAVDGLKYTESCTAAGQDVTCHGELVIDKLVLDAKQYAEFHDAMAKLGAYERRVVLLTKS